jgi:putative ABC transport system permease protein
MSAFKEIRAVTGMGLRSVPARLGTSLVVVVGVAAVVAVLISALAIATGFRRASAATGSPARAVVLSGTTESGSQVTRENAIKVMDAPGVEVGADGQPVASAETLAFVPVSDRHSGLNAFATLRGVGRKASALRPEIKLVAGRMFSTGAHEVVVGRAVQQRLGALEVDSGVTLPNGEWKVVGVFESGGDAHESELLTDADTLLDAYRRNGYNTVTVALDGSTGFDRLSAALDAEPSLAVKAQREDDYYAAESRSVSTLLLIVAYGIGGIMAFGAVFGALNTMYSAVSTRTTEIATLRAIGFGAGAVVVSVLAEALVLGLAGALVGGLAVWLLLNGSTVSTMTGVTPSQLTFALQVRPGLVAIGIGFAVAIAAVGGLFAALRAARVPVASAMRMS